jgi:2-polyprenyl-6-methoxyphenol hydroxylase-like FAD-dependent oxidoreductase
VRIAVIGAGVAGLGTALASARAGHEVVVLERDDTPTAGSADQAFAWARRGAPQVRHSHAFLARLRNLLRVEAPEVLDALLAAGATELPFTANLPATLADREPRPGDDELVGLACRRTTFEWVLRGVVLAHDAVELRHATAVTGLRGRASGPAGVPRVTGVRLDGGGVDADLVVDARGPRATADAWLAALGAGPVPEELHESGIVYCSRFYRLRDDADAPPLAGPVAADLGYLKFAVFVGDNRTFSITFAVDARDDRLRRVLLDTDAFEAVAAALEPCRPWRARGVSEPITDVHVMAGLRNRYRPLVAGGVPIVHGYIAVGDAAVCTNPLYGRGCSLALVHAFGVPPVLAEHGDDLGEVARAFATFTERELVPWFRSSVLQDDQARRAAADEELPPEDPRAFLQGVFRDGLVPALRTSPVVFRAFLRWFNLLAPTDALMADPDVVAAVLEAYQERDRREAPPPLGPATRDDLLARLAG